MKDSDSGLHFIDCNEEQHAAAILAILNDAIVNSTALYDYVPRPPEAMVSWFATKRANGFPVVGVIDDSGTLMGFASWGTFRAFPAYKYTMEHSVYVHPEHRGKGLGKLMLNHLADYARSHGISVLRLETGIYQVEAVGLYEKYGFTRIPPFGDYWDDPVSLCYEKLLTS